jgi:hypothetical protein
VPQDLPAPGPHEVLDWHLRAEPLVVGRQGRQHGGDLSALDEL